MQMVLTQKNRVKVNAEERFVLNRLAYHSARLFNVGLYSVRKHFFEHKNYLNYAANYHACKANENYKFLLSDTAQQVLRIVDRSFKSFFGLLKKKNSGAYQQKVKIPQYKGKEETWIIPVQGRSVRVKGTKVYVGLSQAFLAKYNPSLKKLAFDLPKHIVGKKIRELRILPKRDGKEFDIEFVYEKEVRQVSLKKTNGLSIDFGLNNFVSAFSSIDGSSFLIDGRYIKAINRRYNKELARLQSIKDRQKFKHVTKRMFDLNRRRSNKINDYFNRSVKYITDYCLKNNIGTIVLGDFEGIKKNIRMGKKNNQNFVQIPYCTFKQKISSKCEQLGIDIELVDEAHTSKCSFLDKEEVKHQQNYLGSRVKRGLFKTAKEILVNADINGAANILRKYLKSKHRLEESLFERVCKGFVNNPVRVRLSCMLLSSTKAHAIAAQAV